MNSTVSNTPRKFLIALTVATIAKCSVLSIMLLAHCCISEGASRTLLLVVPCFALLTFLLYSNIVRSNAKSPKRFVAAFIGAVSIKLFACAIFLGLYFYLQGDGKVQVALGTMLIYVVFNVLMIRWLMGAVK